ncbi:glutathione S-transferase family protein [uncultured Sphingomonas sp.]|uniref:glutathione S-transferase family protein n=1 Tax=uncultured Sphingomonas sp. TaxID=158754 RepID=UPI0035CBB194
MKPTITAFAWVPAFARTYVRDMRPRWAFEETGQDYAVRVLAGDAVKSAAERRHQPFGQVPSYSDGVVDIFESGAICLHIARAAPGLLPDDPGGAGRAEQWVIAALNSVEPFVMAVAVNDIFEADRPWSKDRHPKVIEDLRARLADLSAALGDRTWLDGDTFTVGDLVMVHVLRGALGGPIEAFPNLAAYVARGEARPAYQRALAAHLANFTDP